MNPLIQNILKHISLRAEEEELHFLSIIEIRKYKAKTLNINAGAVCRYSYFLNSGLLRSFNVNNNTVEYVLSFACEE